MMSIHNDDPHLQLHLRNYLHFLLKCYRHHYLYDGELMMMMMMMLTMLLLPMMMTTQDKFYTMLEQGMK